MFHGGVKIVELMSLVFSYDDQYVLFYEAPRLWCGAF
jgi:hypothetical protein